MEVAILFAMVIGLLFIGVPIAVALGRAGHRVVDYAVLPDEPRPVADRVREWLARDDCDGVVVCGGVWPGSSGMPVGTWAMLCGRIVAGRCSRRRRW